MGKNIAAGNWKMNLSRAEAIELAQSISNVSIPSNVNVILGVPAVYLETIADICQSNLQVSIAAQNCHQAMKGAYTGEISIPMLQSISVNHVIVGHSERREIFGESDSMLKEKVDALLENSMIPIFCCGEPLSIREEAKQNDYVKSQLENSLFHLSTDQFEKVIIAYEPIWAIGTGKTASPQQAQDMHAYLRQLISEKYTESLADSTSILYGGSVKPANAKELFSQSDVDGGLVGGASLKIELFEPIINAF